MEGQAQAVLKMRQECKSEEKVVRKCKKYTTKLMEEYQEAEERVGSIQQMYNNLKSEMQGTSSKTEHFSIHSEDEEDEEDDDSDSTVSSSNPFADKESSGGVPPSSKIPPAAQEAEDK